MVGVWFVKYTWILGEHPDLCLLGLRIGWTSNQDRAVYREKWVVFRRGILTDNHSEVLCATSLHGAVFNRQDPWFQRSDHLAGAVGMVTGSLLALPFVSFFIWKISLTSLCLRGNNESIYLTGLLGRINKLIRVSGLQAGVGACPVCGEFKKTKSN